MPENEIKNNFSYSLLNKLNYIPLILLISSYYSYWNLTYSITKYLINIGIILSIIYIITPWNSFFISIINKSNITKSFNKNEISYNIASEFFKSVNYS